VPDTPDKAKETIKIEHDPNAGTWKIYTPSYFGGVGKGYDFLVRGGGKGQTPEYFQIYVTTTTPDWYFLNSAIDIDGHSLSLTIRDRDVLTFGSMIVHEDVAVNVTREYFEAHREKPIQINLYGKRGTIEVSVAPQVVNGFLQALDDHLATQ
jgi:hypothetical protein